MLAQPGLGVDQPPSMRGEQKPHRRAAHYGMGTWEEGEEEEERGGGPSAGHDAVSRTSSTTLQETEPLPDNSGERAGRTKRKGASTSVSQVWVLMQQQQQQRQRQRQACQMDLVCIT